MKIDGDLRAVIRAAEKAQPKTTSRKSEEAAQAIKTLLTAKPGLRKKLDVTANKLKALHEKRDKLDEEIDKLVGQFNNVGITYDFNYISSKERFQEAGGVIPPYMNGRWKADEVISLLAAAEPEELHSILLKYGINWK